MKKEEITVITYDKEDGRRLFVIPGLGVYMHTEYGPTDGGLDYICSDKGESVLDKFYTAEEFVTLDPTGRLMATAERARIRKIRERLSRTDILSAKETERVGYQQDLEGDYEFFVRIEKTSDNIDNVVNNLTLMKTSGVKKLFNILIKRYEFLCIEPSDFRARYENLLREVGTDAAARIDRSYENMDKYFWTPEEY